MFWPDANFDALLVDGVPCVDKTENCAKDCDCEGDGFYDGHRPMISNWM